MYMFIFINIIILDGVIYATVKTMEDHSRTIIHIDIDCFYAQVEMVKQPHLKNQPLGIQQKNIVVTSNYIAREYGIKKCMLISEAKRLCPKLVLVNGEDLYHYRHVSNKVSELLQEYSGLVERLGLDENFIDVTELVSNTVEDDRAVIGCIFGDKNGLQCDCGCMKRLTIGSRIGQQIRNHIFKELNLTTCAGIAHNKLLAKIAGTKNKPNNQTTVFPNSALELMLSLEHVQNIPWIGHVSSDVLKKAKISKVSELQQCNSTDLEHIFDPEKARNLVNLSLGIDNAPVKKTSRPLSIGLEEACKGLTIEREVEFKLNELLKRLLVLVNEDGRIPKLLRVSLRKFAPEGGIRETRQCHINIPLNNEAQLLQTAMGLFRKAINNAKTYKITLLGLSLSKFTEKPLEKNTLNQFLMKTTTEQKYSTSPPSKRSKLQIDYPPNIHLDVFNELPVDIQQELLEDYRRRKEADKQMENKRPSNKKPKINTLFNYMAKEPKK